MIVKLITRLCQNDESEPFPRLTGNQMEDLLAKLRPRDVIAMLIVLTLGGVACFHIWTHAQIVEAYLKLSQQLAEQGRSPEEIRAIFSALPGPRHPHHHLERRLVHHLSRKRLTPTQMEDLLHLFRHADPEQQHAALDAVEEVCRSPRPSGQEVEAVLRGICRHPQAAELGNDQHRP